MSFFGLTDLPLTEVLLGHVLRRLGDAVALEALLNAEMTDGALVAQATTVDSTVEMRQELVKFKTDLKARIEQIPRVNELDWEACGWRSADQSDSRRKRALEDQEPGLT